MALNDNYEKRNKYPKIRKSGIYPVLNDDNQDKQLGLDNDNLEEFSLGTFPSVHRSNRIFVNPNQITLEEDTSTLLLEDVPIYLVPLFTPETEASYSGTFARDTGYRFYSEVFIYADSDNNTWEGSLDDVPANYTKLILSGREAGLDFPYVVSIADFTTGTDGNFGANKNYGTTGPNQSYVVSPANVFILPEDGVFDDDMYFSDADNSVYQEVIQWMEERQTELYDFLRESPIFIKENPIEDDESYGTYGGNYLKMQFTDNKQTELDVILNKQITVKVQPIQNYNGEQSTVPYDASLSNASVFMRLKIMFNRPKSNSNGDPITFDNIRKDPLNPPIILPTSIRNGESSNIQEADFFIANLITFPDAQEVWQQTEDGTYEYGFDKTFLAIDDKDVDGFYNGFIPNLINDDFVGFLGGVRPEREEYARRPDVGWPNFFGIEEDDEVIVPLFDLDSLYDDGSEVNIQQLLGDVMPKVDYQVHCFYGDEFVDYDNNKINKQVFIQIHKDKNFLYYDFNNPEYQNTSYPVTIGLVVDLFETDDFQNQQDVINLESYTDASNVESSIESEVLISAQSATGSIYRYEVIGWGDEETPLTDDLIENSFYFNLYDTEEYPSKDSYEYLKNKSSQYYNSVKIIEGGEYNVSSHTYTTPGPKSIKIMIYRYTKDGLFLLSSTLITKNININDGLLKSQDFSIFGGTDFKFLPLGSDSSIIGGLDEDSDFNDSVEKIKKDDNFIKEDYLERQSAKNFIDDFNNGLFGKSPSQLDLSLTRVFTKPIDLYYFIGAGDSERREQIRQNNFELNETNLPINSFATDIFIDDEDCIIDINPTKIEFGTVSNKKISSNKAILTGDYKLNQPEESKITKQGAMQIPLIENDSDKQAF